MDPVTTATLLASVSLQFDPLLVLLTESADTGAGSPFQPWIRGLNIGFLFVLLFGELGPERVTSRKKKKKSKHSYSVRSYKEGFILILCVGLSLAWSRTL